MNFWENYSLLFTCAAIDFLWQGSLVALLAGLLGSYFRESPIFRHTLYLLALLFMAACFPLNFVWRALNPGGFVPGEINRLFETFVYFGESLQVLHGSEANTFWLGLSPFVVAAYFVGVLFVGTRFVVGIRSCRDLRHKAEQVEQSIWLDALLRSGASLKMRTLPSIAWSREIVAPVVIGIWRPIILIPLRLRDSFTVRQIEALLTHELAHLYRFDPWIVVLQRSLETVFFFHPAVWWISRQIELAREEACDDLVVNHGADVTAYAHALLMCSGKDEIRQPVSALAATGAGSNLLRNRLMRILGKPSYDSVRPGIVFSLVVGLICFLAISSTRSSFSDASLAENISDSGTFGFENLSRVESAELYAYVGQNFLVESKFSEAKSAFQSALEIDPSRRQWQDGFVAALFGQSSFGEALNYLEPLIANAPNDAELLRLKANALMGIGDYLAVAGTIKRIDELGAADFDELRFLGEIYVNEGSWSEGANAYRRASRVVKAKDRRDLIITGARHLFDMGAYFEARRLLGSLADSEIEGLSLDQIEEFSDIDPRFRLLVGPEGFDGDRLLARVFHDETREVVRRRLVIVSSSKAINLVRSSSVQFRTSEGDPVEFVAPRRRTYVLPAVDKATDSK